MCRDTFGERRLDAKDEARLEELGGEVEVYKEYVSSIDSILQENVTVTATG